MSTVEGVLSRALQWARRRRVVVLAGSAALAIGCLPLIQQLTFDSNVLNLLPQRSPALRAFGAYLDTFGSQDRLYLLFEAPAGAVVEDYAEVVASYVDALAASPLIDSLDAGVALSAAGWGYLLDRELLLLGPEELEVALARLGADTMTAELVRARGLLSMPSDEIKSLVRQDPLGLLDLLRDRIAAEAQAMNIDPGRSGYTTPDGRTRLVIAKPVAPPYDTAFCRQLLQWLESVENTLPPPSPDPFLPDLVPTPLTVEIVGPYRGALETEDLIRTEGTVTAVGSLAGVLLVTFLVFRSMRVLLCAAVPLLLAALLTAGLHGLWFELSTAASGSAAMLFGVSIDGVLLLYFRYLEERGRGVGSSAAIGLMAPAVISMMIGFTTTAATYFGLVLIDFPSLEEIGRLIGMGILLSGVLTVFIVPALLPEHPARLRFLTADRLAHVVCRHRRALLAASVLLTVGLGLAARDLRVVPTLQKLRPQTEAAQAEAAMFAQFAVPDEIVLMLAHGSELEPLLGTNEALVEGLGRRAPAVLVTAPTVLIPPTARQESVRRAIADSGLTSVGVAARLAAGAAETGFRPEAFTPFVRRLPTLLNPEQHISYAGYVDHGLGDLVGRYVADTAGGFVTVAYAYPQTPAELRLVETVVSSLDLPVSVTGVALVNDELSRSFAPQFFRGALIGTIGVAALVFVGFRSLRDTALAMVPTALGLVWSAGILALLRIELDLFSVFALLMAIGIGVDYSIHVLHRHNGDPARDITASLARVAPAILLAGVTTLIGFGSLVTSSYPPLASLGIVASTTILTCLLTSVVVLPAWLSGGSHRLQP